MAESTSIYCTERGYMEIPIDVYTGLVERSERLAVYEELMRGYNPVTLILSGKKQIRKKQRKEERQERERAQEAVTRERIQAAAMQADEESKALLESLKAQEPVPTCPDPDKLVALIHAGFTTYRLADEFKTDVETVDIWASRLAARAEDTPEEAETKPADPTPAEEAPAADPAPRPGRPLGPSDPPQKRSAPEGRARRSERT